MELSVCERPIDQAESEGGGEVATRVPAPRRAVRKSAVQIRLPVDKDWPAIREMLRKQHARTIFAHIPFSEAKYEALEKESQAPSLHQFLISAKLRGSIMGWFIQFKFNKNFARMFRINWIKKLLLPISLTAFLVANTNVFADCVSRNNLNADILMILESLPDVQDVDHISKLIDHIDIDRPLFCEQEKIKSSGLLSDSFIFDFYGKYFIVYQLVGKHAILTLTFDYKTGNFRPQDSGIRTKKTNNDYQISPLGDEK